MKRPETELRDRVPGNKPRIERIQRMDVQGYLSPHSLNSFNSWLIQFDGALDEGARTSMIVITEPTVLPGSVYCRADRRPTNLKGRRIFVLQRDERWFRGAAGIQ